MFFGIPVNDKDCLLWGRSWKFQGSVDLHLALSGEPPSVLIRTNPALFCRHKTHLIWDQSYQMVWRCSNSHEAAAHLRILGSCVLTTHCNIMQHAATNCTTLHNTTQGCMCMSAAIICSKEGGKSGEKCRKGGGRAGGRHRQHVLLP